MSTDILEVQNKLRILAGQAPLKVDAPVQSTSYSQLPTEQLQEKYNKIESWLRANKGHERFFEGTVELKKLNKELARRKSI